MRIALTFSSLIFLTGSVLAQTKISWVSTTPQAQWKPQTAQLFIKSPATPDVELELDKPQQSIHGFGTCFNELGWTSLGLLPQSDREKIFRELYSPGAGANFTICRMPIGANDFSRNWYSYNETEGDFEMKNFDIKNDQETLIPFIKAAKKYNPSIRLWASPWSPPQWMKYNKHYAGRSILGNDTTISVEWGMHLRGINNGLPKEKEGKEGTNMFIQEEPYFKAYALYFAKFIEAYRRNGINIDMVMPQNEYNSAQFFPSATWTAAGLARFIPHLGEKMQALGVKIFFGTVERANPKMIDSVLTDPKSAKYIKGVGFQWDGKNAIPVINKQYSNLSLYQTEQECGNGMNDWKYAVYTWGLMKHYLSNGANAYLYWNTSLKQGGISTWGWKQNSLVVVDTTAKTFRYTYDYYFLKHLSHYVKPGARRIDTNGSFYNLLAFVNPDKSIIVVAQNETAAPKKILVKVGNKTFSPTLEGNSLNTFRLSNE
ncbi:MAG TPA: glycoside hydrolase family 30 protein [Pedobacter sp.]|jgi:glucosylceramidase